MAEHANLKGTILVVDDDSAVRRGLYWTLSPDYRVFEAESRSAALDLLEKENIDVVVSDLHLPPHIDDIAEGLGIVQAARGINPPAQVVVITASDARRAALEAVKLGAYGFFQKPLDAAEVVHIVSQAGTNAPAGTRECAASGRTSERQGLLRSHWLE